MKIVQRNLHTESRSTYYKVIPLGDIHIGAANCDEVRLRAVVKRIAEDPDAYWIGMGDYCEFINVRDPRWLPASLASWVQTADLIDLGKAQVDRFIEIVSPIAKKCLALVEGNHEGQIARFTERAIFSEIVSRVKEAAGYERDMQIGIGMYGYLKLALTRQCQQHDVVINLHHGFVGGRLAGAKALEMQRWLWTHDADVVLFGHSHNTSIQIEQVEGINNAGELVVKRRFGCYSGTFMKSVDVNTCSYSEAKGYLPLPLGGVEIQLHPGTIETQNLISVRAGLN